jgi:hypothetical protein
LPIGAARGSRCDNNSMFDVLAYVQLQLRICVGVGMSGSPISLCGYFLSLPGINNDAFPQLAATEYESSQPSRSKGNMFRSGTPQH